METRLAALGTKAGPVLFQLPARFKADEQRLRAFLAMLSPRRRYAFEFRDKGWYTTKMLQALADFNIALCISDHRDAPSPWEVTARHAYVRAHGPTGDYRGRYPKATMRRWAQSFLRWSRNGVAVYCYFDNDQKSAAPKDALELIAQAQLKRRSTTDALLIS
jgi:uncharacterized protein YecE (DUF72 family)